MKKRFIVVVTIIFVVLAAAIYALEVYAPAFHFGALEAANVVMAVLSLIAYFLVNRQVDERPQAFVRGVYSASFLKLMVCMVSILVYVLLNRAHIHKPSVFMLFGIYAVYTIAETWLLSKVARE
jgi:hypothetical protein